MRTFSHPGYKRFLLSVGCLLSIHFTALFFLTLFRLVFFFSANYDFPDQEHVGFMSIWPAFIRGVWFDNVIACYILLIPLVAVSISALFNYYGKILWNVTCIFFSLFYGIVLLVTAANIPYFQYFFKIINSSVFNWFGYMNTTAGICIGLCLFGIRGRTGYNPIKVSAAYYCTDPFLNQLGISPVFNLLSSTLDDSRKENRYLHLMPENEALENTRHYLNRPGIEGISPIARQINASDSLRRPNIVLIFMESMSAHLMKRFGQQKELTPFLDSLYRQSLAFSNFYSSGIHTNHGMYATLYSFPSILKRNAMKGSVIPTYSGLPTILKEQGYRTMFFMTHESQYDNMNAFFRTNGFDEIFSQENYPSEKVVNGFGVQDDFLYDYALNHLKKQSAQTSPFFAVLLSISNHPPYVIPSYFQPKSKNIEEQIVEYADWSIRQFIYKASQQPWFDNTIFVLLGDHGKLVGNPDSEMPQSYNHIPLMFYAPALLTAEEKENFGGQIDVAPTLLGMLRINYIQNNLGIDLLKEERPCMFFSADNMLGVKDTKHFYIYDTESKQEFNYNIHNGTLSPATANTTFDSLKTYAFSMLQTTEYLIRKQLTTDKPHSNP